MPVSAPPAALGRADQTPQAYAYVITSLGGTALPGRLGPWRGESAPTTAARTRLESLVKEVTEGADGYGPEEAAPAMGGRLPESRGRAGGHCPPAPPGWALTIRRDLRIMEAQGLVRRSYGRVFPVESGAFETPLSVRSQVSLEEKMRIAAAAVEQVRDAQLIFVDEGYTPELIARNLPQDRRLTVVTSSLPIAMLLASRPSVDVLMLGGRVRGNTLGVVDHWTVDMLRQLNLDLAFLGANGVTVAQGMTTPDPTVAAVKSAALASSARRIFIGAHHKFATRTLVNV